MPQESVPVAALVEVLEAEQRVCRRLFEYAEAKREALIAADVERLFALLPEMTAAVNELGALEAQRLQRVQALTGSAEPATVRLDALVEQVDAPAAARLAALKRELGPLLERVRGVCGGNLVLARQGAALSERWLRLLGEGGVYSPEGAVLGGLAGGRAWTA